MMGVRRRAPQGNRVDHRGTSPWHYGDREKDEGTKANECVGAGRAYTRHRRPSLF